MKRKNSVLILIFLCLVLATAVRISTNWNFIVRRSASIFKAPRLVGLVFNADAPQSRKDLDDRAPRVDQSVSVPMDSARMAVAGGWYYTVRRGDTIYNIARRTGTTVGNIRAANGLWSNALRIGQRIFIPTWGRAGAAGGTRISGDTYMLARLISAEAGTEPYVGKVAVGAVVINRTENPRFPNTIPGVIFQPHAFESVSNGIFYNPPVAEAIKAARDAINGWDPSGGALYFFNPAKTNNPFIWSRRIITRLGKHVFAI